MNALLPYIVIDVAIVAAIVTLSAKRLSFFHPLTFYLFFHAFAFSLRAIELYGGKYPMYFGITSYAYYSAVTVDEFIRGLITADIALVLFTIGCLKGNVAPIAARIAQPINDKVLRRLLVTMLPISFALLAYRRFGGAQAYEVLSGFQLLNIISGVWPIALIAIGITRYGARWPWIIAAAVYFSMVGTQGYHRFQLLLPIIMLFGIYLARKRYAWPGAAALAVLISIAMIFPSLKYFGQAVNQKGLAAGVEVIINGEQTLDDLYASRTEMFFDQFAGSMTLTDALGSPLMGRSYIALLALPIPRAFWPDKPSLGSAAVAISVPGRPFSSEGRIVTVIGEAYLNFGYVGIIVVMFWLGYFLTRYYRIAFSIPQLDPFKLAYIGFMTSYLQAFRDGLLSLIMFSLVAMAPLFIFALLNGRANKKAIDLAGDGARALAPA